MPTEERHSVKFAFLSLLGPFTAVGLILAAMLTAFVAIEELNSNPTVWICLGVLLSLLCCFSCFSWIAAIRLNPFEYDSNQIYLHRGMLNSGSRPIRYRDLEEVLYSQNLIEKMVGTGTIVLMPREKGHAPFRLKGVPNVESVAGILEKLRLVKQ